MNSQPLTLNKRKRPRWADTVAELRTFAKSRCLSFQKSGTFYVVLISNGVPVSHLLERPWQLRVEEDKRVWGQFTLLDPYLFVEHQFYVPYQRELFGFGLELPDELEYLAVSSPGLHYYTAEEQAHVLRHWENRKESDEWLKEGGDQVNAVLRVVSGALGKSAAKSLRQSRKKSLPPSRGSPLSRTS